MYLSVQDVVHYRRGGLRATGVWVSTAIVARSSGVSLYWLAATRLVDMRGDIIRRLADEYHGIDSFRLDDAALDCRFRTRRSVRVSLDAARAYVLGSDDAWLVDVLVRLLEWTAAQPGGLQLTFQHVLGWPDDTPLDAVSSLTQRNWPGAHVELPGLDFAIMVDGAWPAGDGTFQVEYGVVTPFEVPLRLSRFIGRTTGLKPELRPEDYDSDEASLSTFVDSTWTVAHPPNREDLKELISERLASARRSADTLAAALHEDMTNAALSERK